tara:strand:+ start:667 stop:1110 length:444 start_codon:yes stop_codon:yes gene_type:complete
MNDKKNHDQRIAIYLGYFGLAPFVVSLLTANYMEDFQDISIRGFSIYSAVIISFMSGIHWGMALTYNHRSRARFVVSTVAPVMAWAGLLFLPLPFAVITLGVIHLAGLKTDTIFFSAPEISLSYRKMRLRLTCLVVGLHFLMTLFIV